MIVTDDFLEIHVLMCRAISKPVRLKLLNIIGKKKMNVSDLQRELDVPLSNLSNHLNDLYRAGILGKDKQGNFVYYFLTEPKLIEGITRMQETFRSIIAKRNRSQY
jgi:ArsR family transcriptional regulator